MSIARPAAEIEPQLRIFSSNWIWPGQMRPSESRSIRTLSDGSDLTLGFDMEDLLCCSAPSDCHRSLLQTRRTGYISRSTHIFRGVHELSFVVFSSADRSVPAQTSPCDGASNANAGGKAQSRAPAAERGILWATRDVRRIDHRRSLAGRGDRFRKSWRSRHLFGAPDQRLARGRRCRSRQGRSDFSPALACRTGFALLVPARRRVAGRALGGADFG